MSNPTSNFGWQMPTPTDLVTDLPADFEVFGQAVDTSLADLKGGTTGQILAKATNTDMDFVWTSPNPGDITGITATSPLTGGGTSGDVTVGIQSASTTQSGAVQLIDSTSSTSTTTAATPNSVKSAYDLANAAIPKSLVDAKADIITATADNTPARLAVGTNGQTLVADSSTSTGLKWATPASSAQSFSLLNSGGTSLSGSSTSVTGISGMNSLYVMVENASSTSASSFIYLTFNSDTTAANYSTWGVYFISTPVSETNLSAGGAGIGRQNSAASGLVSAGAIINGCNSTAVKVFQTNGSGDSTGGGNLQNWQVFNGIYSGTSTISSVQVRSSSGTFDNGKVYIYGSA